VLRSSDKLVVLEMNQDLGQEWLGRTRHHLFHTAHYHGVQAEPNRAIAYLPVYGAPDKFVALPAARTIGIFSIRPGEPFHDTGQISVP
jgi:hypothetical protein